MQNTGEKNPLIEGMKCMRHLSSNSIEYPQELVEALLVNLIQGKDVPWMQEMLNQIINTALEGRDVFGERMWWREVDILCAQAVELYISISTLSGIGWQERDAGTLAYLRELYWKTPDRINSSQEEKTNCVDYLVTEPCMQNTKEVLLSWVVGRWDTRPHSFGIGGELSKNAFDFLCEVFEQGKNDGRKTTEYNISVQKSIDSCYSVNDKRTLMKEDEKMLVDLITDHCSNISLEQVQKWTYDDIPDQILKIFQEVLVTSLDRAIILKIIKESVHEPE